MAVGSVLVGWAGSERRGFQQGVFNKADRRLRASRLSESRPGASARCHWDRENPDITFFNLEFLFVWSVNAFKSREPADETTTAISCYPWGNLCPSCSLTFITICSFTLKATYLLLSPQRWGQAQWTPVNVGHFSDCIVWNRSWEALTECGLKAEQALSDSRTPVFSDTFVTEAALTVSVIWATVALLLGRTTQASLRSPRPSRSLGRTWPWRRFTGFPSLDHFR